MKACVLHGIRDIRFEEATTPVPAKGEALIKIKASGICGSDIPIVMGALPSIFRYRCGTWLWFPIVCLMKKRQWRNPLRLRYTHCGKSALK